MKLTLRTLTTNATENNGDYDERGARYKSRTLILSRTIEKERSTKLTITCNVLCFLSTLFFTGYDSFCSHVSQFGNLRAWAFHVSFMYFTAASMLSPMISFPIKQNTLIHRATYIHLFNDLSHSRLTYSESNIADNT